MPFKSKAQQRLFFAKEERGELPKGKALEWARETKNMKKLPEHVKKASVIGDYVAIKLAKTQASMPVTYSIPRPSPFTAEDPEDRTLSILLNNRQGDLLDSYLREKSRARSFMPKAVGVGGALGLAAGSAVPLLLRKPWVGEGAMAGAGLGLLGGALTGGILQKRRESELNLGVDEALARGNKEASLQKTAAQGAYWQFKGAAFPTLTGVPDVGGALAKHVGGALDQKAKAMDDFMAAWDAMGRLPTPEARARAATDIYIDALKGSKKMGPTVERFGRPIQETVLKALTRLAK